ncbi:MAG: tryptophan--tRNA ligase [Candidatus Spechtbacteria bacterium]|nr:tryptophan--tRNA ligase [Candidatus Spechtbacteria bacterium]
MRILSGIQPTGQLHLGNYLGALQNFVALQETNDCYFMIADLHALTVAHEPKQLAQNTRELMRAFLAIGLDPKRSVLFVQSHIPAHTELAWIFNTITPLGELERMTQFKEKTEQSSSINLGLLSYPVLMAADILLYKPHAIPVGEDQVQHLEMTRSIARKFTNFYGKLFVEPEAILTKSTSRVMSLQDPTKKMSKSLGPQNYVGIFEDEEIIKDKIKKAVTDSGSEVKYNPKAKPAISNLLAIYSMISGMTIPQLEKRYEGRGYADFKNELADAVIKHLKPIREKFQNISDDEAAEIFEKGGRKARTEADAVMKVVRKRVGLV